MLAQAGLVREMRLWAEDLVVLCWNPPACFFSFSRTTWFSDLLPVPGTALLLNLCLVNVRVSTPSEAHHVSILSLNGLEDWAAAAEHYTAALELVAQNRNPVDASEKIMRIYSISVVHSWTWLLHAKYSWYNEIIYDNLLCNVCALACFTADLSEAPLVASSTLHFLWAQESWTTGRQGGSGMFAAEQNSLGDVRRLKPIVWLTTRRPSASLVVHHCLKEIGSKRDTRTHRHIYGCCNLWTCLPDSMATPTGKKKTDGPGKSTTIWTWVRSCILGNIDGYTVVLILLFYILFIDIHCCCK